MATEAVRRVKPLRHAVELFVGVNRDLKWLRWMLVTYTASSIWARYKRYETLFMKGNHSGALDMWHKIILRNNKRGIFGRDAGLIGWIDGAYLHETYMQVGAGAATIQRRLGWVGTLIVRAVGLTLGSGDITWFLHGVATELSKRLDEGYELRMTLAKVQINNEGQFYPTIMCEVLQKTVIKADAA